MPRCPLFGRYQGESGHNSDIVKPTRLTFLANLKATPLAAARPTCFDILGLFQGSPAPAQRRLRCDTRQSKLYAVNGRGARGAAVWAFNDLLRKCGKRAVVENPLFD